jgi:UPF0716 family protein affecting phage T7 exclusion
LNHRIRIAGNGKKRIASMAKWFVLALFALPGLEIAAFVVVASQIGFFRALLLVIGCSLAGVLILRHAGQNALARLRAEQRAGRIAAFQTEGGSLLTALGAVLLVIPGFITSILALPLLFAPVRRLLARGIGRWVEPGLRAGRQGWTVNPRSREAGIGGGGRVAGDVIDLSPEEWRQVPRGGETAPSPGESATGAKPEKKPRRRRKTVRAHDDFKTGFKTDLDDDGNHKG